MCIEVDIATKSRWWTSNLSSMLLQLSCLHLEVLWRMRPRGVLTGVCTSYPLEKVGARNPSLGFEKSPVSMLATRITALECLFVNCLILWVWLPVFQ